MQMDGHERTKEPQDYSRRLLVAVTGMSPQIVTETLYALAVAQMPPFIPTGIRLITTEAGAQLARQKLLEPGSGQVRRLCADYGLPPVEFEAGHVMVLEDSRGQPMSDIRDVGDNTRAADTIAAVIHDFTQDEDSALHVSIAGGRKTMGFYMGYALSLFGRAQDRMSHVLVSEPYESAPDFFYPTRATRTVCDGAGNLHDARDAKVTLADIPFVRLRAELPLARLGDEVSFTALVEEAQRALSPLPPASLKLNPTELMVIAGGVPVRLPPAEFAFYWMLAVHARDDRALVQLTSEDQVRDFADRLAKYRKRVGSDVDEKFKARYTREDAYSPQSHINRKLKLHLGERFAEPYLIRIEERQRTSEEPRRFGLGLPSGAIVVEER